MKRKPLSWLMFSALACFSSTSFTNPSVQQHTQPLAPEEFQLPEGLEVSVWAESPLFYNPTNIDMDHKGRMWIAEGRNYRRFRYEKNKMDLEKIEQGDRIVVVEDKDGDGVAESSHTFYQDPELIAPLGVAVIGNKVLISQPPHLIQITDVNENAVYDEGIDKKEVLLSGFMGKDHDHSLHSLTVGPNGQYYFNFGNCGAQVRDRSGWVLNAGSAYTGGGSTKEFMGKPSSDGRVYTGGVALRMNPDATGMRPIGHNFRNSYEQVITSFGDVFQNDNDDPPACRTTWLMEHGNLGFFSDDGSRFWRADAISDQDRGTAEWRQEVPGTIPAGDVYGGGAPTGIAFYENGIMEDQLMGTLLTCEPSRNVVFSYVPRLSGAGFPMKGRQDFITSNTSKVFAGSDFVGGNAGDGFGEHKTLFRPSDVMVGPDGAIYVSDWFDQRVGGHATLDNSRKGFIYRIAPKGSNPQTPKLDLNRIAGQIQALKSPAVNVRASGFYRLRDQGEKALPAVKELLADSNIYIRARAVHLLAQLGPKGLQEVVTLLQHRAPQMRIAAYRALRHADHQTLKWAEQLSKDSHIAVRREVALSLRYEAFKNIQNILKNLYTRMDPNDRWYVEALGMACDTKESEAYAWLKQQPKVQGFDAKYAKMVWRLHPEESVSELLGWAKDNNLSYKDRRSMMFAIAYTENKEAALAMVELGKHGSKDTQGLAKEFIVKRMSNLWSDYNALQLLTGIKPSKVTYENALVPEGIAPHRDLPSKEDTLALKGDVKRGEMAISRCTMCHVIDDKGVNFGPTLTGWGKGQPREVIYNSIVEPNRDIAHGFMGSEIETKSGKKIQGFITSSGNPTLIQVFGGSSVLVYKKDIKRIKKLKDSLMMPASKLGLSAQEIRDIIEYMKHH